MHKTEQMLANAEISAEFADEREAQLAQEAIQGRDVEEWLQGPVGRFVVGAAVQDMRLIEEKLVTAKSNTPWRRRRLVELQQQHEAIRMAISWLSDAVAIGEASMRELSAPYE